MAMAMSEVSAALDKERDQFRFGADRRVHNESRSQARHFQAFRGAFEQLCPSLRTWLAQETDQKKEIELLLSSIHSDIASLAECTACTLRSDNAAQIFYARKDKRLAILEKLDDGTRRLTHVASPGSGIAECNQLEIDKAGPDGVLSKTMKSCWRHICNIYNCVILQPNLCECTRHVSYLRLHRQAPDEQVGADMVFRWGPKRPESKDHFMQEVKIRSQPSFVGYDTVLQNSQIPRPGKSEGCAQDIQNNNARKEPIVFHNLCKSLDSCDSGVMVSDASGYLVTTLTARSPSSSEKDFRSLESILMDKSVRMPLAQSLSLAHAIASSHLRLHPTPWLGCQWTSKDIFFAVKNGLPLLEQPLLRRRSSRGDSRPNDPSFKDDATSTLGIILLELYFDQTITSFAEARQEIDKLRDLSARIDLARAWSRELNLRIHDDYEILVSWCLAQNNFRIEHIDNEWRQDMQNKVIKPLEELCKQSIATSLILCFDKIAWKLRGELERQLVRCDIDIDKDSAEESLYHVLALDEQFCPHNALKELIQREAVLLKRLYVASYIRVLSLKNHVDIQAIRMGEVANTISEESTRFYDGILNSSAYQKILGTFILAMTDPPSKAWFNAWERFISCCRGGDTALSQTVVSCFPLEEEAISKLYTGQHMTDWKAPPANYQRADMAAFRSSQCYFWTAKLKQGQQRHDQALNDRYALRLPFTSIRRIGSGSSADVYRVKIQSGHYDGAEQTLAMKVLTVGTKARDEWAHTTWMRDQLRSHECIMSAKTSLRLRRQVLVFYESAECDLRSYMTTNDPPVWMSRREMVNMIREIADAMDYLHRGLSDKTASMSCFHKDMKTENILVVHRSDGQLRLKLTDFGISSVINERSMPEAKAQNGVATDQCIPREYKTSTELTEGLPNASPEMHNSGLVDAGTDIWAFGTVLAEYTAWLFGGRHWLEEFEQAKSAAHKDNPYVYYCAGESVSSAGAASNCVRFVLKEEIGDWFESAISRVQQDRKMLENLWWLLKSHILVCDANVRGKSEDISRWLGAIFDGTFNQTTDVEPTET